MRELGRTEEGVPNSRLLGCAEENLMRTWPLEVHDELDGAPVISDKYVVVREVLGFS